MRLKQLDALRAFSIGLVMVEHWGGDTVNALVPIGGGKLGVGCFFTLSGFLITGILLQSFDSDPARPARVWRYFYVRRLLRLAPAFYAVILALVLLGIQPIASSWPWHAAYLTNIWVALGNPSNVFWSLAVEEQFYLLWPIAILLVPRRHLAAFIVAMIVSVLVFKFAAWELGLHSKAAQYQLYTNIPLLGAGCLLAVISGSGGHTNHFEWYRGRTATLFTIAAWLAIAVAVLSWLVSGRQGYFRYMTNDALLSMFFAWVILNTAIGWRGIAGRIMDNAALQYVGQISYGLYLVHNWMPKVVESLFGPLPKWEAAPIVVIATFAVCAASWHLLEKPALSLKKYFAAPGIDAPTVSPAQRPAPAEASELALAVSGRERTHTAD
jgi:peptidoglycan/LPS O-acetylase OafA/YrhL